MKPPLVRSILGISMICFNPSPQAVSLMRHYLLPLACMLLCVSACTEAESDPQPDPSNNSGADMRVAADMKQPKEDDMRPEVKPDLGKDPQGDMRGADEDMATTQDMAPDMTAEPDMKPVDGCGKDHPRVGWTATLSTKSHGVRGTAVIVDNCTVEVRNFFFDGRGLDVKLYGTKGTNFRQGWPMSEDLIRSPAYMNETVIGKLPQGRTLDDLDAISVWCIDIPVDFGSGTFKAP